MATPPNAPSRETPAPERILGRTRLIFVLVLSALLLLCFLFTWTTRDAMRNLPYIAGQGSPASGSTDRSTIVNLAPWRTAQALAPLAVTAEETEYARQAERLADHEVDQAFAAALRQASIQAQHRDLSGEALALSQKVQQFQKLVAQDQAQVRQLTAASSVPKSNQEVSLETDLDIAKAQLGLDSDQLADATLDLNRATGDQRAQIQSELSAHEAQMKKYDESREDGQMAVISVRRYSTLAGRMGAWNRQQARAALIAQAISQTQDEVKSLTAEHNALEAAADAGAKPGTNGQDTTTRLAGIRDRSAERQLLSIYDDRIQTEEQLITTYQQWRQQVGRQHRILLHLLVQSVAWIFVILLCMVLGDAAIRRAMEYPVLDRRQRHTLRTVLEFVVQLVGAILILLVIFGAPRETPTILGLATAALTIALQDFVLAFFGWFVLMGRKGIRVGDLVEINGVGGEVTELGLMSTTLLETGSLADRGYPTGRRITFMNSFAIRGQYFNFSTAGQWMWDQITVAVPSSVDTHTVADRILAAVQNETQENSSLAELEWKRALRGDDLGKFHAVPVVNLHPAGAGWEVEVRYVSRASRRFELRNRLYGIVADLLKELTPSRVSA